VAFALLATSPFTIASETVAEGSMRLEHADWRVADAMAWQDGEELEIVFSDKPFDRAAMTADGELDVFDFMRHGGNRFAINLDADGPTMCVDMTTQAGDTVWSGSNCNSEFPPAIRITTRSADRVAGSMQWESGDARVELRFDLPVEAAAAAPAAGTAAAPTGEPLPADGGEPGKAMLAHFAAVHAGDWEKLKGISHPDRREMMQAAEEAGEHAQLFELLRNFAPKDIRITGGSRDGDTAQVTYEATEQGAPVKGIAEIVLFEGSWYFAGSTTEY